MEQHGQVGERNTHAAHDLHDLAVFGLQLLLLQFLDVYKRQDRSADTAPCCGAWDLQSRTDRAPDIPGQTAAAGQTKIR